MKKGCLIFAHNNRQIDYGLLALISGGLAKKNLRVPISLVTDKSTVDWMHEFGSLSKAKEIFENIIIVERPVTNNTRKLSDGTESSTVPFINSNRYSVWELTPYDRTLLLDSDFLMFTDNLGQYWNSTESLLIGHSMNDLRGDRVGELDKNISETGVHMYWATTVMFTKNSETKLFFDLVEHIKVNYKYYSDLYRFNPLQYRNDIAFSVAKHILDGYENTNSICLPPINTVIDKDILCDVDNTKLTFLISDPVIQEKFIAISTKDRDVHIMNKQSIIRNSKKLLELI
jgi:hypothetical protein